jgi:hypothetical protein
LPELTREAVVSVIKKRRPSTIASLKKCLKEEKIEVDDEELLRLVGQLQSDRSIKLFISDIGSFKMFLGDIWDSWWFYLALIIAVPESFLVIFNVQTGGLLFLRIVFALGILGIIPGFLTVQIVFPGEHIKILEKIALSIFLSVLISITVGVLLGLGPFFQSSNNIIVLTGYVILADLAASYRSYDRLRTAF